VFGAADGDAAVAGVDGVLAVLAAEVVVDDIGRGPKQRRGRLAAPYHFEPSWGAGVVPGPEARHLVAWAQQWGRRVSGRVLVYLELRAGWYWG